MIGESFSLASALPIVLRRKKLIIASGLVTACLAFGVTRLLPLRYVSEGSLIIEHSSGEDAKSPTVLNSVLTQADVLQSKALIRRSVQSLPSTEGLVPTLRLPLPVLNYVMVVQDYVSKLLRSDDDENQANDPLVDTANYVQEHMRVETKDSSSVISIRYEAGSPAAAAAMVNAIMSTYVSTVGNAREVTAGNTDQWISKQMAASWRDVEAAEQRVTQFMKQNPNLTEVQGSLTSNLQLSRDKAQLALAREELARQQAAYNTIVRSGGAGADETLNSKSIQALKEIEAKTLEQINSMYESDPRRLSLQSKLNGTRALIKSESAAVIASIARAVEIARARVQALENSSQAETESAQVSTVAAATLKQLTNDLEAKRQIYVEFLKGAGQAQLAAVRAPAARIMFQAVPPSKPTKVSGALALLLGFFGGSLAAAGLITIRSSLGTTVSSTNDMTVITGLPVFGSLPVLEFPHAGNKLLPRSQPIVTETFRGMCLAMRTPQNDGGAILVTSSEIGEGKTTTAAALARSFADDGFRVLLVDADLRRPRLSRIFDLKPKQFLESVLDGTAELDDAVVHDTKSDLAWICSNGSSKNPVRALSSEQFRKFLDHCKQVYDFVILNSAPVLHVVDPILLAGLCQHIVFIVQSGRLSSELVGAAIQRFGKEDRGKIFTLLTRVRAGDLDARDYFSGYASA